MGVACLTRQAATCTVVKRLRGQRRDLLPAGP